MEIFWVEDFLSGEVIDNKYYSTREEASICRNAMGYGLVKEWKSQKATGRLAAFHASPGETVKIE